MVSCVTLNTKAWVVICWDGVITKMKCDLQSNVIPYLAETGHFWTRKPLKSSYHGWNNRHCKFAREMIFCSICSRLIMLICRHPHLLGLSFGLIENLCTLDFKQWLAEDFTKRVYHRISMQLTSSFFREIKSDNDALFTSWSCVRKHFLWLWAEVEEVGANTWAADCCNCRQLTPTMHWKGERETQCQHQSYYQDWINY